MSVINRFLNYVKFDTMANGESKTCPSTSGQLELGKFIVNELQQLGLTEISFDENGYIMASLDSNVNHDVPVVGFIAHMDTSDALSGKDIKPRIVKYDGNDIELNKELNVILSSKDFPELKNYLGQDLIVTDGTTLLGADDKAGIAEIISAVEYLKNNPQIKHGKIRIGFTPDEEIGRGADKFDVKKFGADFAYTIDGGEIGELQYENFNAAGVKILIKGQSVHPGEAKNKMINAVLIASKIANEFPNNEVPEHTSGYEGFYHLVSIDGNAENASLTYIIRDFDRQSFENRKAFVQSTVNKFNSQYGKEIVKAEIKDQYYNMKEIIEKNLQIVDIVKEAMNEVQIEAKIKPIRGGTDGSRLSYMGLPTPNIFSGGHNYHGKFEFIPTHSMEKAVDLIVKITTNLVKN